MWLMPAFQSEVDIGNEETDAVVLQPLPRPSRWKA